MKKRSSKATFALNEDVLAEMGEAVAKGAAPSKNAFVERSIVKELKEFRRRLRKARWQEAARDPLFLRDIDQVESEFSAADAETASGTV